MSDDLSNRLRPAWDRLCEDTMLRAVCGHLVRFQTALYELHMVGRDFTHTVGAWEFFQTDGDSMASVRRELRSIFDGTKPEVLN